MEYEDDTVLLAPEVIYRMLKQNYPMTQQQGTLITVKKPRVFASQTDLATKKE